MLAEFGRLTHTFVREGFNFIVISWVQVWSETPIISHAKTLVLDSVVP